MTVVMNIIEDLAKKGSSREGVLTLSAVWKCYPHRDGKVCNGVQLCANRPLPYIYVSPGWFSRYNRDTKMGVKSSRNG